MRLSATAAAGLVAVLAAGCEAVTTAGHSTGSGDFITTVYLTEDEALATALPAAARRVRERVKLSAAEHQDVEAALGARMQEREFTVHAGLRADGSLDGFAVIHSEIGKFKPFDFVVAVEPDGSVRRVAVLVYRESRGAEVAQRRFHSQYIGKRTGDPIRINRDILNVSGATMSVQSMNAGVKKVLAVIQAVYMGQPHRLERLISSTPVVDEPSAAVTAPSRPPGETACEVREARLVMGALCEIRAFGVDGARVRRAVFGAFEAIEAADRALSDYRPDSEVSRLGRHAGGAWSAVSPLTGEFLRVVMELSAASSGACDITVGPLVAAWGGRGAVRLAPSPAELQALRPLVDWRAIELRASQEGWQARLRRPGMRLDPGAVGKGFAVDLAVARLRRDGVTSALIDFSGNMYALGAPPRRRAWEVAVCDPARPGALLGTVSLRDRAIASSGAYERRNQAGGASHCHIVSPLTLAPVRDVLGTTVLAPTAAEADAYSTAAFVLGGEAVPWLETLAGVDGTVSLHGEDGAPRRSATQGWRMERES